MVPSCLFDCAQRTAANDGDDDDWKNCDGADVAAVGCNDGDDDDGTSLFPTSDDQTSVPRHGDLFHFHDVPDDQGEVDGMEGQGLGRPRPAEHEGGSEKNDFTPATRSLGKVKRFITKGLTDSAI